MEFPIIEAITTAIDKVRQAVKATFEPQNGPVASLGARQRSSLLDRGPSPSLWTCQVEYEAPKDQALVEVVIAATKVLSDSFETPPRPTLAPVRVEWVGSKYKQDLVGNLSPAMKLKALAEDTSSCTTIIFLHGGNFIQNSFGTSRPTAAKLAKLSGGRVIVVDYRLAPQNAFPSQLLDILVLYLQLISPSASCPHPPVDPASIVITGESSGGNLALAFIALLLTLQRMQAQPNPPTLPFNGRSVPLVCPAGIATVNCMADYALCLPSWQGNKAFDIFNDTAPQIDPKFPADEIWPTKPPRADPYCSAAFLGHPLISTCLVPSWAGAPRMWFAMGQERLRDGAALIAQRTASENVPVQWNEYKSMPHSWPLLLPKLPHSLHCFSEWGKACRQMVEDKDFKTEGRELTVERLEAKVVSVGNLTDLTIDRAKEMIVAQAATREPYVGQSVDSKAKI